MTRGVRNPTRSFDTGSMEIGGWEGFLDMTADAPGERSIEIADAGREFEDKAAYEAFMNEPVGIVIEAGGDRDEQDDGTFHQVKGCAADIFQGRARIQNNRIQVRGPKGGGEVFQSL